MYSYRVEALPAANISELIHANHRTGAVTRFEFAAGANGSGYSRLSVCHWLTSYANVYPPTDFNSLRRCRLIELLLIPSESAASFCDS